MKSPDRLSGIKEISEYTGRPWETVQRWITNRGFPAIKLEGRWESIKALVDEWFKREILKGDG
jgi:excisionase family DNA binding protein